MKKALLAYIPIAQAIAALLHPFGEVVLHDLRQMKIAAIFNHLSKRKVGDDSLLEEGMDFRSLPDFIPPYYKTNWNGKRLKSVSSVIKDEDGLAVGLLCINLDIWPLQDAAQLLSNFLSVPVDSTPHKALFADDWQERMNTYVHHYLASVSKNLESLSKDEKRDLVRTLKENGAFRVKNAATYIGAVLSLSRATVYKYLREADGVS